jgi:hypothetical protein
MDTWLSHVVRTAIVALALALPAAALAEPAPAAYAPAPAAPAATADGAAPAVSADELARLPDAKPPGFTARVEPDRVELGRPFRLTLEVRHDPAERYALAGPPALGGLTARGTPVVERTEKDGVATTRIVLELAAFDALGDRDLPEQTLVVEGPSGRAKLVLPGPPLHVVAVSEGDRLENPPPVPLPVIAWDRIAIAAGALLALALAAFAFWRWRHRRQTPGNEPIALDRRTPEERALADLDALETDAGPARERYFRLSAIVRGFLAAVSDLPAVDRTTIELCDELARRAVPGLSQPAFRAWLDRGDLVRFARAEPGPDQVADDLAVARDTVREVAAAVRAEEARRAAAEAAAAAAGAESAPAPKAGEGGR